ncbi:heterodisulfide reductase-related iron-sulfur binding cluster [Rhodococcoides corynebacterioides]|uniref:heterodisulfide reductase-related iron-sulfur binding cluster n=1 Tax=Rhodococcoides corynebacterioides TaxID=53972 RepID=UPI0008368794|nr:heterodisulfide reductase-related iron-sulfur binding cluster [Rhodococcus corynebacterioides]
MNALTITLGTVGALLSIVCWAYFFRGAILMVRSIALGQPDRTRLRPFVPRFKQMVVEFAAHTRMNKFRSVGWAHWLVMIGFMLGAIVWFEAYGQTFNPEFHWPLIGDTAVYHLIDELLGLGTVIGITTLIIIRQRNHPRSPERLSRFSGSNFRAAYFVEAVVLIEGLGMIFVKAGKIATYGHSNPWTDFFTMRLAELLPASPNLVSVFAFVKLMSGMVWLLIVGRNITWGVAWHRFSAFFNIYFKREDDGGVALGAAKPMMSGGKVLEMEDADPDVDAFGAGKIEDFSWKGWLDFTTCTECGRCQSQCPAWNTGKPLSPKLLITSLRDHGNAKAPYLLAGGRKDMGGDEVGLVDADGKPDEAKLNKIPQSARDEAERPLVGETTLDDGGLGGIIDPEVLWSCTNCGACVEQCPVDIEHVDHILDMRRYQVLIESEFPQELAGLFKNLENKGNPWGQNASARTNWISELEFDVPVFGQDAETFEDYEYLFWVGCAGAYEDRAKKTTKAVAELLATAGVKFMVLGAEETCTGDSARRAGNEFLFQQLAMQNIETLNSVFEGVEESRRKIVVTCAHCFNALGNEYPQVGGKYEVVHHTQLLNRLVRAKKLIPVATVEEDVTYHDPCFLGRHNKVYDAPRELMAASGSTLKEMPRHGERSMCCGAGGARMWMEEKIGKRINIDRVDEALDTLGSNGSAPSKIATGCPFCRVMLNDGVTARQEGGNNENVEVIDVSQMLLSSITRLEPQQLGENVKVIPRAKPKVVPAEEPVDTPKADAVATEDKAAAEEKGRVSEVEAAAEGSAPPATASGKGLKMKGLAKAPGAKAPGAKAPGSAKPAESPNADGDDATDASAAPAAKPKGLGMAGKAKAPGAKGLQVKGRPPGAKAPGKSAESAAPTESAAPAPAESGAAQESGDTASSATEVKPTVKAKGLAVKSGFKKPGAKAPGSAASAPAPAKTPAAEAPEAPAASEASATEAPATEAPAEVKPTVKAKGLAVKSGYKKPGAKAPGASAAPKPEPAAEPEPAAPSAGAESTGAAESNGAAESSAESNGAAESDGAGSGSTERPAPPQPKAGGLGFKSGAKAPGRKS